MEFNIIAIVRHSVMMMVLLGCSMVAATFTLERWWYLRGCSINMTRFMMRIEELLRKNHFEEAIMICEKSRAPLARVIHTGLVNYNKKKEEIEDMMSATHIGERVEMERFLYILMSLGPIAPLLGLLGTVVGLVKAFRDLALAGSAGPSIIAAGIGEALYTTIAGLIIAVPTVLAYNYFANNIKKINMEIDASSKRLLVFFKK